MELWIGVVAAAVVVFVLVATLLWMSKRKQHRTELLQGQFGDEYTRTVEDQGQKKAEAELIRRQERVSKFELEPINEAQRGALASRWTATQAKFVDEPGGAVSDADALVSEVMQVRGYPMGDFEQRAADVSVDHAQVVSNYRSAHEIALRHSGSPASTEELRQAMVHYRALFTDLLGSDDSAASTPVGQELASAGRNHR